MSKEPRRNVYVGHRYVPKIMGEWDKEIQYEGLSIVTYQGTSYTSKKRVPVGIDILDEDYWVVTGNYNAQVEYYRRDVNEYKKDVNEYKEEAVQKIANYKQETYQKIDNYNQETNQKIANNKQETDQKIDNYNQEIDQKIDKYKQETTEQVEAFNENLTAQLAETNKDIKDRGINLNTSFPRQPTETNDSPRIQRAIDSLGMDGGHLFFPEGVYELSEPVTFDAINLILSGVGRKSILRPSDSFTGNSLVRSLHSTDRSRNDALENVIIERLTFDGREKEIIGVLITGFTRGCSIRDNTFNNFEGSSINLTGSWSYSIERNHITGSNKNGIGLDLGNGGYGGYDNSHVVNQSRIVGNSIRSHHYGIRLDYGNNNLILGNTVEYNNFDLVSLSSSGLIVIGNYFEMCTTNSMRLGGVTASVKDAIIKGNFFYHGENANGEINIIGLEDSIISNNQYHTNATYHIIIPENNRGVIKGNTIESGKDFGLDFVKNENTLINKGTAE